MAEQWETGLQKLPPEMLVEVMKNLSSFLSLGNLIQAHPAAIPLVRRFHTEIFDGVLATGWDCELHRLAVAVMALRNSHSKTLVFREQLLRRYLDGLINDKTPQPESSNGE